MANMAQSIRMALHYGEKYLGVKDILDKMWERHLVEFSLRHKGLRLHGIPRWMNRGIVSCAMVSHLRGNVV